MRQLVFKARPKSRQPPKSDGTQLVIAAHVLSREFMVNGPIADFTYIRTPGHWLFVAILIDRFSRRRMVHERSDNIPNGHICFGNCNLAQRAAKGDAVPFRSGQPIHQRTVPKAFGRTRYHLLDEPVYKSLG